jgi:hypothetical protein
VHRDAFGLQHLRELKCDGAQGYLFSKAVGADAALEFVRSSSQWLASELFSDQHKAAFDALASTYSM